MVVYYKPVVSIKPSPAFNQERFIRAKENWKKIDFCLPEANWKWSHLMGFQMSTNQLKA